jgi:glucose-6-phosphate isomerase
VAPAVPDTDFRLPGALADAVGAALGRATGESWASRVAARDTSVWTSDAEVAEKVGRRLGWLGAPEAFTDEVAELEAFASALAEVGYTDALVCGMGGSSLAPEVLARVLPRAEHGLHVRVLDSTDPAAVRAAEAASDPARTMRIVATKSGTTTETLAFLEHLWAAEHERVGRVPASETGDGFVLVTDPGHSLEAIPHHDLVREVFLNPEDVGGRYSALTYVGLVPGALQGLDLAALLADAREMAGRGAADDAANPGLALGTALGALAREGRDKLTFVIEPALAPLGAWLEQLVAESTGKSGTGIVPVDGERLAGPEAYLADRVFVRIGRPSQADWWSATTAGLDALTAAGHPVIDIALRGGAWVGGEFYRWELATAVAGAVLGVDPFDEPNVTESKRNTAAVLERFGHEGELPAETPLAAGGALRVSGDAAVRTLVGDGRTSVGDVLRAHLGRIAGTGYHAVCAFIAPSPERTAVLRRIQARLRDRTRHATTLGFGPRFLHSTGQLHKGGAPIGCFLQLVAGRPGDLPIPGRRESFGVLIDAQALGDFASLEAHGLPVLRVHLSDDADGGLAQLESELTAVLG